MSENICCRVIDEQAPKIIELAQKIWNDPEMGWTEKNAVAWTAEYLRSQGFDVEVGAYGMPTAIRAVWGTGAPVVGFCAEYDCLPGLSQKIAAEPDPVVAGGVGHGCGHNLLGAGCAAACVGLKAELEASGKPGTVVFYGCPAEEQMTGKGFMARAGAFRECDFTVAWHPANTSRNTYGTVNGSCAHTGVEGAYFHFKGRTAHAAGCPEQGRSALDAVQLMNNGVEYLREHVTDDVRIHYIIIDGGLAPNIVPDTASSKYFIRALSRSAVVDAFKRVENCARGAAIMTDTTYTVERIGGIYPTMQNHVLMDAMQRAREEIPQNVYTREELDFADRINSHVPGYKKGVTPPIDDATYPVENTNGFGSTDYGDVQHIVPGVALREATAASLVPGHSWMMTACAGSSIGMKGMIRIGKIMALGTFRAMTDPAILAAAKEEFEKAMNGETYVCPVTDEIPWPYK